MIKAVIFDMFETLVTLFVGRTYFSEDIARDLGIDVTEFRREWHKNEHDRTIGKLTIEEGIAMSIEPFGICTPENVALVAGKRNEALGDTFGNIPDETFELLGELKKRGIKIGLITNTFSDERALIRSSRLFPYFDAVRISYEEGVSKPDPSMYLSIMEEFGAEPAECLYVGDGGSKELYAARELGMNALQAGWFQNLATEGHLPCPLLPDFPHAMKQAEVPEWVK